MTDDDGDDTYSGDENLDMVLMYGDEQPSAATIQGWICRECGEYASTWDGVSIHVGPITDHEPKR